MTSVGFAPARLVDICEQISSGGTPSRKHPEYFASTGGGHLWVRSQELVDRPIHDTGERISDDGLDNSSAKYYPSETVLIAMYGATVGKLAILRVPATVNQAICALRPRPDIADYRYVFYALMQTRSGLTSQAMGAAQQNLNQDLIRNFEIPLPGLGAQQRIAAVLSAYDELIENNTRRIQILEEMAQAIYREWFVEFRYPGHEDVPLVDSDLGPIPESWTVEKLGDVIELVYGKALKATDRAGGAVAVYGSGGLVGWHDAALVDGPGVVVGRKGNVGAVYWSDGPFFPIDTTYYVRTGLPIEFAYYSLRSMDFIDSHAAVPGLSREQAYRMPFLVPDDGVLAVFAEVIKPNLNLRHALGVASDNLRTTRDLLLSRLLSGEIDVSDLDIDLGDAAA